MAKKHLYKTFVAALILLAGLLGGCTSDIPYQGEIEDSRDKTLRLHIMQATNGDTPRVIEGGDQFMFNGGSLYMVDTDGAILRHFTILPESSPTATNTALRIINSRDFADGNGVTLPMPNIRVHEIVVIGNTAAGFQGNINVIGAQVLDIISQHDALDLNLFGRGEVNPVSTHRYEAHVELLPSVARFEIPEIRGCADDFLSFTVDGIFITNFHREAHINHTIPTNSTILGGANWVVNNEVSHFFPAHTPAWRYNFDTYLALHDLRTAANTYNPATGLGIRWLSGTGGNPPLVASAGARVPNSNPVRYDMVWSYQVFAAQYVPAPNTLHTGITEPPRIVIQLSDVILRNGTLLESDLPENQHFITVTGFRTRETTSNQVTGIRPGHLYRVNGVVFTEEILRQDRYIEVEVAVELARWNVENTLPSTRLRTPHPEDQLVNCFENFLVPLGSATGGTWNFTYQWQRNVYPLPTGVTVPDPNNAAHWVNISGANAATLDLAANRPTEADTWFRRRVTDGTTTIYSRPARATLPVLTVSPTTLAFARTGIGSHTVTVTRDIAQLPTWTVEVLGGATWLTVPTTPQAGTSFSVTAVANPHTTERTATIRVSAACAIPRYITVTQPGREIYLEVTPVLLFPHFLNGGGVVHTANIRSSSPWTATFVPAADGIITGVNPALPGANQPISNNTLNVGITAPLNTGAQREARIRITTTDNLTAYIRLIQMPGHDQELPGQLYPHWFVGAFWRNNQQGERLLRGAHAPYWTAIAMDNWIKLDREDSDDPNVFTNNTVCMTTNDSAHRLPTTASGTVSGNGDIIFRIGLRTYNTIATNPRFPAPRWSQVVILYGDDSNKRNTHIIWIRQGEQAHYVFTPTCPGASRNTTNVGRWSPFNLTHPGITNTVGTAAFPARAGMTGTCNLTNTSRYFVRYPSQAGVLLQWASDGLNARRAWSPINSVVDWSNVGFPGVWDTVNAGNARETCPPGWRRPGVITNDTSNPAGNHAVCMLRQSLWLQSDAGRANSVFGLYADGFFDRRERNTTRVGYGPEGHINPYSSVAWETPQVAYRGRLFFNPTTGYHLFLPAAGRRNASGSLTAGAAINRAGTGGYYWSSATNSDALTTSGATGNNAFPLQFADHMTAGPASGRIWGMNVRCVRE